jgi:hypothetical protein
MPFGVPFPGSGAGGSAAGGAASLTRLRARATLETMAKKKLLTSSQRGWLARFFQNATLILLAAVVGGDVFLKVSLLWRMVLALGVITGFLLGLVFARKANQADSEEGD